MNVEYCCFDTSCFGDRRICSTKRS